MASLNKVILIGNLGADPEIRYTASNTAVTNFRIATTERWNDKQSGERREQTEWHRIVVWGRQAEHCNEYLSKGRSVYVEGRLQYREWEDKDGNKRWTTEINANQVLFLGGRGEGGGGGSYGGGQGGGGSYGGGQGGGRGGYGGGGNAGGGYGGGGNAGGGYGGSQSSGGGQGYENPPDVNEDDIAF